MLPRTSNPLRAKLLHRDFRLPAKLFLLLRCVEKQSGNANGTEVVQSNTHDYVANIRGVFSRLEANGNVNLCAEVVDLLRLYFLKHSCEERRCQPIDIVYLVSFGKWRYSERSEQS